jgi:hypothetical protein
VWQFGGRVALSNPEFIEFACDWTGEAVKVHPNESSLLEQRAEALLFRGHVLESVPMWRRLARGGNPSCLAALTLCEACSGGNPGPVRPELADAVNREFVNLYRRLLKFGQSAVVLEVNRRLSQFSQIVPGAARMIGIAVAEAA